VTEDELNHEKLRLKEQLKQIQVQTEQLLSQQHVIQLKFMQLNQESALARAQEWLLKGQKARELAVHPIDVQEAEGRIARDQAFKTKCEVALEELKKEIAKLQGTPVEPPPTPVQPAAQPVKITTAPPPAPSNRETYVGGGIEPVGGCSVCGRYMCESSTCWSTEASTSSRWCNYDSPDQDPDSWINRKGD
jgi:hypothetical protein